jgi:non-specific serine/threonine protein kinase
VGKTRLAIQAAEELAADFSEGVAFIELAALADPALLPGHVAAALGVREAEAGGGPEALVPALGAWLTRHRVLLVLDNCEHLLEATAALVHALLEACPDLRILATSRQRLGITGEVVRRVPSLPAPDPERLPADEASAVERVLSYPAVQLFVERAAAAHAEFQVENRAEAVAVAQICGRLDGIPLALELAAARVGPLTLPQIAARLDDRFRLLTGGSRVALPRQQTLRALIDWSYELLPEAERTLLCRLSVFAGGWSLEAAEAVCSDFGVWILEFGLPATSKAPGDRPSLSDPIQNPKSKIQNAEVLDLLSALEEKSLVLVEQREGAIRYRLLETVREYAREKLEGSGERAAIRDRHRDCYLRLAEQFAATSDRPEHTSWLVRLEAELDNLRAALAWCQEAADAHRAGRQAGCHAQGAPGLAPGLAPDDPAEAGLRLANALWWLWMNRGYLAEGQQWLEQALARSQEVPAPVRAAALLRAAHLASARGDPARLIFLPAARHEHERALALVRQKGDRREIAYALVRLADVTAAGLDPDLDMAWSLCVEARQLFGELGDPSGLAGTLEWLAKIALERGDRQTARAVLEERLAICRKLGGSEALIHALGGLGHLERDEGDYARARAHYQESLLLRQELGHQIALAQALEDFAVLAGREQQHGRAIRLLGAGEAFCETIGAHPPVALAAAYERTVAEGRAALGEAAFAAAWAEGRAMSLEQAIEYALGEE